MPYPYERNDSFPKNRSVFLCLHVNKVAIPILRAQGGGTVVQFSSVGGRGKSRARLVSGSQVRCGQLQPLLAVDTAGIKVLVVEPSRICDGLAGSSMMVQTVPADTKTQLAHRFVSCGRVVLPTIPYGGRGCVRVVKHPNLPSRLLLGGYAASGAHDYSRRTALSSRAARAKGPQLRPVTVSLFDSRSVPVTCAGATSHIHAGLDIFKTTQVGIQPNQESSCISRTVR